MLPAVLFQSFRLSLMGTNLFGTLVFAVATANVVNVGLNHVLINGVSLAGIPAMGLQGAAWATTLCRWLLLVFLLLYAREPLRERGAFSGPLHRTGDWRRAAALIRQGLPIGGQMFAEFCAFAAMSLIAGRCGTTQAAGHAIIQCLTDLSYVLPLGIGALGSVQVGQGVGGGDNEETTRAARQALCRGALGVTLNAAIFIFLGSQICWWFTSDPTVHAIAVACLPVIAVYQLADGMRVVGAGCLRGVGRLSSALISDVVGFWMLGIPVGYWLALGSPKMNTYGIWLGFAFGVVMVMTPIVVKAWNVGKKEKRLKLNVDRRGG